MPELIEVEMYRRLADRLLGETIVEVETPDAWFVKRGASPTQVAEALEHSTIDSTDRVGKLLTISVGDGRTLLGLRFGMTGRLVLDDDGPIDRLEYSSGRDDPSWNRFALRTAGGHSLRLSDPRRLGGVELNPDTRCLGPDAASIATTALRAALNSTAPLKVRLLDQSRIAGLGNLLVDEVLWRAGLDPRRRANSLKDPEVDELSSTIRSTVADLFERGGSHRGDLQDQRHRDGLCPIDGAPLLRSSIGGRTTYFCPLHQR